MLLFICQSHSIYFSVQQKLKDAEKHMSVALTEAIKGYGADDPHTAEARQNLADRYWEMHKYDLAVPLYEEVSVLLTPVVYSRQ